MCRFIRTGGVVIAALLAGPAAAQTWSGAGGNGNWSNGGPFGNWSGAPAPTSGPSTTVTFAGTSQLATTQDVAAPLVLNALTFQPGAGAFTVAGNELRFGEAANALTQSTANPIAITAPVSYDGSGSIGGTGSLTLSSLHVRQGTLTVNRSVTVGALALGVEGGTAAAVDTGANVLTLAGDVTFVRLTDPPDGFADAPPASLSGVVNLGGADRTFAGVYSNTTSGPTIDLAIHARLTGAGGFVKGGSPTDARSWMTLTNPLNDYTGPTVLEAGSERLYLGAANVIPAASAVQVRAVSELFLTSSHEQAAGVSFSQTIGSLSDGGTAGGTVRLGWTDASPAVLTTGGDNTSTTFAGQVVGGGALVKAGAGTFTLFGANTYTGGTTVAAGTLLVIGQTGTDSGTGTGPVAVSAGGTLGGTGRAGGVVTLRGRLQGGDGAIAAGSPVLTTGAVTFETGSRLRVAVGGPTPETVVNSRVAAAALDRSAGSDVLTVELFNDGTLDLSGTQTYSVTVATYGSSNATAANFGVTAVNFTFAGTPLVTQTGTGLVVEFTPVPEPAVGLVVAATGVGLVGWSRRRLREARVARAG